MKKRTLPRLPNRTGATKYCDDRAQDDCRPRIRKRGVHPSSIADASGTHQPGTGSKHESDDHHQDVHVRVTRTT